MGYYREYVEVTDDGQPYTAVVRLCHDFPVIVPGGSNQVVILDERVAALTDAGWTGETTETWSVLA